MHSKFNYKEKQCIKCGKTYHPTTGRQLQCFDCIAKEKERLSEKNNLVECPNCGKLFQKIRFKQVFCSKKCNKEFSQRGSYQDLSKEDSRKNRPTKQDIREIHLLLKDFGISCSVPEFETIKELELWKIKIIKEKLKG